MINERIKKIAIRVLKISEDRYSEELEVGSITEWDSLAQLTLIQAAEAEFSITFDIADVMDIESIGDLIDKVTEYSAVTA